MSAAVDRVRADVHLIAGRRREGVLIAELAAEYGCSSSALAQALRDNGFGASAAKRDRAGVIALWEQGLTAPQIARCYACSEDTIRRILGPGRRYRNGSPKATARPALTLAQRRALPTSAYTESYARTGSATATAKELGVSLVTARARLGLVRERRASMSLAEMKRRYAAGETSPQIATAAGVSKSTVARTLTMAGVELRSSGGTVNSPYPAAEALDRHLAAIGVLFQAGVPASLLAETFGCSDFTIRRRMRIEGVAKPARVVRPPAAQRRVMAALCADVRSGRLVERGGRLVPAARLNPSTLTIAPRRARA